MTEAEQPETLAQGREGEARARFSRGRRGCGESSDSPAVAPGAISKMGEGGLAGRGNKSIIIAMNLGQQGKMMGETGEIHGSVHAIMVS